MSHVGPSMATLQQLPFTVDNNQMGQEELLDDDDDDIVLGIPIDAATAAKLGLHGGARKPHRASSHKDSDASTTVDTSSSSFSSSSFATSLATPACLTSSVRLTISQRSSHARALVQSPQAFVVFGGYLRIRETSREWRMKTWYCALLRAQLYCYPSKADATRAAASLHRRVTIAPGGAQVSNGLGKLHTYSHAFTFETMRGDVYFCSAPSADEQMQWVAQINQAAVVAAAQAQAATPASSVSSSPSTGQARDDSDASSTSTSSNRQRSVDEDEYGNNHGNEHDDDQQDQDDHDFDQEQGHSHGTQTSAGELHTFFSSSSGSSSSTASTSSCFTCHTALGFGLRRHHRRTCRSCHRSFCRVHCSKYSIGMAVVVPSGATCSTTSSTSTQRPSRPPAHHTHTQRTHHHHHRVRVCDACSQRQHFIVFMETFIAKAIRLVRHGVVNITTAPPTSITTNPQPPRSKSHLKMLQEVAIIVSNPASFTVLNVLCLLTKYATVPFMFTRVICLLIPLYEQDNGNELDEFWVQLLSVFGPLLHETKDPFSPSMQFFLRFIFAICRRQNTFALRTTWECLAFYEDAKLKNDHVTMSYLMLLIISCASFDGNSQFVLSKLLGNAPEMQIVAIQNAMKDFLGMRSVLRDEIPKSLPAKWFNAICPHEMDKVAQLVVRTTEKVMQDEDQEDEDENENQGRGGEDTKKKRTTEAAEVLLDLFDPLQTQYVEILAKYGLFMDEEKECDKRDEDNALMSQKENEFDAQASFVEQLTHISDLLRHTQPVATRSGVLNELLVSLQQNHLDDKQPLAKEEDEEEKVHLMVPLRAFGGGSSTSDRLRLLRVVPEEGKVFSTRSRAPTMMVFEACPASSLKKKSVKKTRQTITMGIAIDVEEEDAMDDEMIATAETLSMRWRRSGHLHHQHSHHHHHHHPVLGRSESTMLDAMLCGFQEGDSPSSNGGSSSNGTSADASTASLDAAMGLSPRPSELLIQEARDTYEESVAASYLASFKGGSHDSASSKWKRAIRATSPFGHLRGWTIVSLIAKSHDDLRQEVFAMQLMQNLKDIFQNNELHRLYLRPYEILCTGANVGLIETLSDAQSVDSAKKEYGSLAEYFAARFGSPSDSRHQAAQEAFITSSAASSLYCYLFQIKDRHNGNIMVGTQGHLMHIDFGFMMGSAPGGAFSLEDAPFKLTKEMVEIMGGLQSRGYLDFVELFMEGFLAVRCEYIKLITLIHLTAQGSPFPCFQNQPPHLVLRAFRQRLFLNTTDEGMVRHKIRRLIDKSYNHWGTRQYDRFQYSSNGIMP